MRKSLLPILLFFLAVFSNVTAQNCVFFTPPNTTPLMCFVDPTHMDGDEITLTEAQFNNEAYLMSLVTINIGAGGFPVDCDMSAGVKIRRDRFRSKSVSNSRNSAGTSKITYSITSTDNTSPCFGITYSLSLNVRVISPIPTLSQWGIVLFALLMLNIGGILVCRKQTFFA